jgi:hypothetical protein
MLVSSMHGQLANHTPTVQLREREREGDPQQQTADTVPSKKDCRHRVIAAFQPFCLAQHWCKARQWGQWQPFFLIFLLLLQTAAVCILLIDAFCRMQSSSLAVSFCLHCDGESFFYSSSLVLACAWIVWIVDISSRHAMLQIEWLAWLKDKLVTPAADRTQNERGTAKYTSKNTSHFDCRQKYMAPSTYTMHDTLLTVHQ